MLLAATLNHRLEHSQPIFLRRIRRGILFDVELDVAQLLFDNLQPPMLARKKYSIFAGELVAIASLMLAMTSIAICDDVSLVGDDFIEIASIPPNVFWRCFCSHGQPF